ncbi:MAG: hypothetical protein IT298_01390 [Chloroflexi bacterium]|jgi:hypothetical protein|nr:hypothetical protein [Chloroflexota bacterium]MBV6437850.1 hypothetical protein [Anaerolineae bacterium]MDL1915543.1 hypothetical protein [Anaerolineae bacterium CFX4]OQY83739.1 MAG: hypothetical protein B6D42_06945 [Anaerolineae bacterium UTCFX5]MCC6564389.1 hypothetical protein [Chloroflexota bacterium]
MMFHTRIAPARRPARKRSKGSGFIDVPQPAVHDVVAMQRVIGNRATLQHLNLLQRLPDSAAMIALAGEPKKKSTRYKAFLTKLDTYRNFIRSNTVGRNAGEVTANFRNALDIIAEAQAALDPLIAKIDSKGFGTLSGTKRKRQAIYNMKTELQKERASLIMTQTRYATGDPKLGGAMIANALSSSKTPQAMRLLQSNITGGDRGGSSEVTRYNQSGTEGFFKQNKDAFAFKDQQEFDTAEDANGIRIGQIGTRLRAKMQQQIDLNAQLTALGDNPDANAAKAIQDQLEVVNDEVQQIQAEMDTARTEWNAKQNEFYIGTQLVGINPHNPRLANRDVAMSRIDQLLGANVIAHAQLAFQETNTGDKSGSYMEKAKGRSVDAMRRDNTLDLNNAKLMQQLSRLHLIDLLCFQVDRNAGNIYISTDLNGNVKVTGIDNDMALGTNDNISIRNQELPPLSKYVDADLANRLIQLDTRVLSDLVTDLLTPGEINAMISRFEKLKQQLIKMRDNKQLLSPDQWTLAVKNELFQEDKSYVSNAR